MKIQKNISLQKYNTFNINTFADYFCEVKSENNIKELIDFAKEKNLEILILGSGSNVLFTQDFKGIVAIMQNKGIKIIEDNENHVKIRVSAGEICDEFVDFCVKNNFYGAENLSHIPGTVGASPVQNIGAYGVEAKDIIYEVECFEKSSADKKIFSNSECKFAYRESIFKNKEKDKYIISSVVFELSKYSNFKLEYGNIKEELSKIENFTVQDIRNTIINIRDSKLPDHTKIPNAGSFFKNPIVDLSFFNNLKAEFSELVSYSVGKEVVKLAAGQLIDLCNLKGKQIGNVAVHENQALVIVNKGNATGKEIFEFSEMIINEVFRKFKVKIQREINVF